MITRVEIPVSSYDAAVSNMTTTFSYPLPDNGCSNVISAYLQGKRLTPKHIHYNGDKTIVEFMDGEKVIVTKEKGSPNSHYLAFCAAVVKRLFGSTSNAIDTFHAADDETQFAMKQAEKAKAKEDKRRQHQERIEQERKLREVRIAQLANELYLKKKAEELATERYENELQDPNF